MKPIFPSPTPTWHNASYPSIDPLRSELSVKGRKGSGIGREIAAAFAKAGAMHVYVLGRTESTLASSVDEIGKLSDGQASAIVADIEDEKSLQAAAARVGVWDVLVISAGYLSAPVSMAETPTSDWWKNFEVNVKGTMLAVKSFAPMAGKERPVMMGMSTGAVCLPPATMPGSSGYIVSKMAQAQLMTYVKAEYPHIFVGNFHPGVIVTAMSKKAGNADGALPLDDILLPAHFAVWLASPEAEFLDGKFVWANWDVDELKEEAESLKPLLVPTVAGWPYPYTG